MKRPRGWRPTGWMVAKQKHYEAVEVNRRCVDALIEIGSTFDRTAMMPGLACHWCRRYLNAGCSPDCPGLKARRALGVA